MKILSHAHKHKSRICVLISAALCCMFLFNSLAAAETGISDTDITLAVRTRLMRDGGVNSYGVEVQTRNGIVTLSGIVYHLLEKERAARITEYIKGVRAVVDELSIKNGTVDASEIRQQIISEFNNHLTLETDQVDVRVTDSRVFLSGEADSWPEKQLYARVVKNVKGVREVDNRIDVSVKKDRPDREIREEIVRRLAWDVRVDSGKIDVSVNDGKLSLSGLAGSAAEKRIARHHAWVAGVTEVNLSGLKVDWRLRDDMQRDISYGSMSDDAIRKAVGDALAYQPGVDPEDLEIHADHGVVTLSGKVENLKVREIIGKAAEHTHGVASGRT